MRLVVGFDIEWNAISQVMAIQFRLRISSHSLSMTLH